jgi:phosphatidylserine/phosphatidylglycerophosphate/cardiolipin synthase-like enzyme
LSATQGKAPHATEPRPSTGCLLLLACIGFYATSDGRTPAATPVATDDGLAVYFSPKGGCTEAVVDALGKAKQTVLVQAYSFTSAPIAKALVDAHKRGVKVTVVLDKCQETEKYSSATFVANAGIPVFIDDKHRIAHNKIILIDETTIITGSFNFTKAAEENNAENLLIIEGKPRLMAAYQKNFKEHREHSHEYERKG